MRKSNSPDTSGRDNSAPIVEPSQPLVDSSQPLILAAASKGNPSVGAIDEEITGISASFTTPTAHNTTPDDQQPVTKQGSHMQGQQSQQSQQPEQREERNEGSPNPAPTNNEANDGSAIVPMPKDEVATTSRKKSKARIPILISGTTVSPIAVFLTSYLLTRNNPQSTEFDALIAGFSNALMTSTFGIRSIAFGEEFLKLDRIDKTITVSLLVPSGVTTAAAYQLFKDSLKNAGYGQVAWWLLLVPNMQYALSTCFMSLWSLYKRTRTFVGHQKNRHFGDSDLKIFYRFRDMLEIHARELEPKLALKLARTSSPTETLNAIVDVMKELEIPVGQTVAQWAITATKMLAIISLMLLVLSVVPPNFLRLTELGLGVDWVSLVLIGAIGRVAIYVTAVLDLPNNTEKLILAIYSRMESGLKNILEKISVLPKEVKQSALAFLAMGIVGGYDYVVTDSGFGLSGETLGAMNSTIIRNGSYPYPSGFRDVADKTFFSFWPTLALYYYVNKFIGAVRATLLSAGLVANANSVTAWTCSLLLILDPSASLLLAFLALCFGLYENLKRQPTPLEAFMSVLEKALWEAKLVTRDLVLSETKNERGEVTAQKVLSYEEVNKAYQQLLEEEKKRSSSNSLSGTVVECLSAAASRVTNCCASLFSRSHHSSEQRQPTIHQASLNDDTVTSLLRNDVSGFYGATSQLP